MHCQDVAWFKEPRLEDEDKCCFKGHFLVKGVAEAKYSEAARDESIVDWWSWSDCVQRDCGSCANVIVVGMM